MEQSFFDNIKYQLYCLACFLCGHKYTCCGEWRARCSRCEFLKDRKDEK